MRAVQRCAEDRCRRAGLGRAGENETTPFPPRGIDCGQLFSAMRKGPVWAATRVFGMGHLLTSGLLFGQKTRKPHMSAIALRSGSLISIDRRLRSLQDNGGNKQQAARALGCHRRPSTQDKRLRHRITPLRLSAQKHWLTIIIAKRRIPRHLLPKLRVAKREICRWHRKPSAATR